MRLQCYIFTNIVSINYLLNRLCVWKQCSPPAHFLHKLLAINSFPIIKDKLWILFKMRQNVQFPSQRLFSQNNIYLKNTELQWNKWFLYPKWYWINFPCVLWYIPFLFLRQKSDYVNFFRLYTYKYGRRISAQTWPMTLTASIEHCIHDHLDIIGAFLLEISFRVNGQSSVFH